MLLGVDVGGTFTDAVLVRDGRLITAKVPSTPADQSRAVLAAVAMAIERAGGDAGDVTRLAHGMTVATNALLEGNTARTALIATDGFTDLVELGRQARPSLYRLCDAPPQPLAPAQLRFGAPERMGPDGPLQALDSERAGAVVRAVADAQPEAVAVVLLHSYADPSHERALAQLLSRLLPGVHVSVSHDLVGTFREYERAATTEVDAALSPLLGTYLRALAGGARDAGLPEPQIMQSSGGLTSAERAAAHAALTVLSGPAGGVGGALLVAERSNRRDVVCFDMGGTSCDVCVIEDGAVRETAQRSVGGRPLALAMLDIHTVGAGGGSIAWRDGGGALRVGPQSAGALPGPACYGRGGEEPTVTDANLLLGRLPGEAMLAGGLPLDADAARAAIGGLAASLGLEPLQCAQGIVDVANAEMLRALRVMTIERGVDPRRFALMPFGGAGPLHACAIAQELQIEEILCPRASGVLSALGLAAAAPRRDAARTVMLELARLAEDALAQRVGELADSASGALAQEPLRVRVLYELRYRGQSFELPVQAERDVMPQSLAQSFAAAHRERYGYDQGTHGVELVTIRVSAWAAAPPVSLAVQSGAAAERRAHRVMLDGRFVQADLWTGELAPGTQLAGPAVCDMGSATLLVEPGWSGEVDDAGTVRLRRDSDGSGGKHVRGARDSHASSLSPAALQITAGALRAVCEEMGAVLIRSAHSSNIKERRDASTALFDPHGQMVMQAEHIPVHLGAMPAAVAAVLDREHVAGRSWILNDPFAGGTHLPDITVITPVFEAGVLLGFAANRAHHADVGGRVPGSMPADSHTLQDEGVVIAPQVLDEQAISRIAEQMRQPAQRRADLRAQLAANRVGALRLLELARRLGEAGLRHGMSEVLDYAERRTRACLGDLPDGERHARDVLEAAEGDLELRLCARVQGERLVLDFAGSAPQHGGNLNCPLAVTRSACYFAVRVLTDPDIPPSAGAHRPVEVLAPEGCLLNARPGAAVAAGNVETSSRVADLVLAAFGRALGQGTMNNLTLGNDDFTYYETLGGGQGACEDADGPSAVHVAMSNTLNTPIEALERDFPLRVTRYALRRGSGGAGAHRGGDGVVRELQALEPMTYSLITERRRHAPPGAAGGSPGASGRNLLDGEDLPGKQTGTLRAGERLRIETPGGGGFGRA